MNTRNLPLFVQARQHIRPVGSVLDIGPGIRPQKVVCASHTLYVEPHDEYAQWLRERGHHVLQATGLKTLDWVQEVDTIVALDVIEHMERAEGEAFIRRAIQVAREQVVIFTPLGFMEQHGDAWGMNGEHWQEHRSGWTPEDFPGWMCLVDEKSHRERGGAFVAIWH